jgi:hypothetical protein
MMGVAGAFIYHTIHQLRLVSHIYTSQAIVNLFDLSPLYAFSNLTSQTAIGFIIYLSMWALTAPEFTSDPVGLGTTIFFSVIIIVTFM